jgi:hypothetical protein
MSMSERATGYYWVRMHGMDTFEPAHFNAADDKHPWMVLGSGAIYRDRLFAEIGGEIRQEPARPLADPTETLAEENRHKILTQCGPPRDGYTLEQEILAQHEEQAAELETLALIAEFRLTVGPEGDGWWVAVAGNETVESFVGPTIADAVRECVSRIRGQQ